ncbi:DUF4158 domain-containing protein [Streptomyces sp. NPDC051286]|uniref:DUF4158 domain-containing protein n=1 Tax=Streptomyces sp. NPDC051286 TaxID=3365647 RepID=UPI00379FE12D
MPTSFLSEEQRRRFGHFTEDPDEGQLAGSFLLDQTARRRAMAARGARNRIGWAVQLGTIRYLGTFLENPEEVPAVVVGYVAEQLGLEPAAFAGYGMGEARWGHQEQIREGYGYTKFEFDQWFTLARWLYQRAWIGNERPTLLFDLASKRLVDKEVVLPGVTVLERLVSGTRERAEKRLWATLAAAPTAEQAERLQQLVVVPTGKRLSELDRLRRSPRDICATAWPPVLADGAKAGRGMDPGLLGSVKRADGTKQLTLAGWPLYRYAQDTAPRQTRGQGVGGTWFAAAPDGTKAKVQAHEAPSERKDLPALSTVDDKERGTIVRDGKGRRLYRFTKDTAWPMKSNCEGARLEKWKPAKLVDKKNIKGIDPKLIIPYTRFDGTKQLTIDCWPLYWYTGDRKQGDINGQGLNGT